MKVPSALESPSAITVIPGQNPNLITRIPVQLGEGGEVTQVYYTLDGSTSYISSDFDSSAIGTGDISISCWIRVDTVPSGTKYVWILGNDNLDNSLSLRIRSTKLEAFGRVGTEDAIEVTAANTIVPDLWTHVVVTRTGTTIELFVNGTSNASGTNSEAAANLSDGETWIGYHIGSSSFAGDFANFEIRNAVLTDSEIYDNFNAGTAYTTGTEQTQTLTPTNATTTNLTLPVDWSNIWGFYFDGVNDYIEVPDSDNLSLIDGSNDAACSFEAWIYPQDTTNFIICSKTQDTNNREYMLRLSSGRVQLLLYDGGFTDFLQLIQTATLSADEWHHIIITYDGSEVHTGLSLYVNGSSETAITSLTGTYNGQNNTTGPLNIGRWTIGGHATGLIDEFIIHSKELSSAEVATRYNAGTPSDPRSLNPLYYLHEATGADWSGNNHIATLQSGAEITANVPVVTLPAWENSHSLDFNGTSAYVQVADSNDLSFGDSSTDSPFSISAWIKNDAIGNTQRIVAKGSTSSNLEYNFTINGLGDLGFYLYDDSSGTSINTTTDISLSTGVWYHVVGTYDGSGSNTGITVYVNGVTGTLTRGSNGTYIAMHNEGGDVYIGSLIYNSNFFNGKIAHTAIWNVELDAAAITKLAGEPIDLTSDDGDYDNSSNLVAYWPFISGAGAGALDHSGNSNHGTIIDATWTTDLPVPAFNRYSVDFDGVDDYAAIADANDLSFGNGSTDSAFSISAWVKMGDATRFRVIAKSNSDNDGEYIFVVNGADNLFTYLMDGGNSNRIGAYTTSTVTAYEGLWTHIAMTYDGGGLWSGIKLYINGVSQTVTSDNAGSYTAMHNTNAVVSVGRLQWNSNSFANGKIDEVAIIPSELSAAQVTAIYNSGEPADLTSYSPTVWTRFEEGTGTSITDSSGNGHTATLTNGPTFSIDVPT